jgi:hypothetical protein
MDRETGFYWVYFLERWTIAKYNKSFHCWTLFGDNSISYPYDYFKKNEIDENQIIRNNG